MISYSALITKEDFPIIITGKRHSDCIKKAFEMGIEREKIYSDGQGFLTHDLIYMDRETAAQEAFKCGQITIKLEDGMPLFSEDLW